MPVDHSDHRLAATVAADAGRLLLELRARLEAGELDPTAARAEGDRRSHELIMAALADARPGDAVLSEEGKLDPARLEAERVWIVDPLDGTREFGEPPRVDWAVHVALVVGGTPVAGAVALPALDVTLSTDPPPAAPPPLDGPPRVVVSRTRPPAAALTLAQALGGELVEMGSAGAKAMAVLRGEADVYAHSGGQYEWDSAAPVAVAAAAGLHTSRIDGSPLRYNNADPYLPDLLICRPELADRSLAALAAR
ncbi:MAG TPA: 3'(2'),5'-bisphosphate nucleotidase CysQ [Acidimicrobiales bacterium]|jgi:3'(2'), 5'-bisphosphate nucleotidase